MKYLTISVPKNYQEKMKICFATNNKNKLEEISKILGESYSVQGLEEVGCHEELPENQTTLEGNSMEKAQYVAEHYQTDCFADDSGLEVDALDGAPGVYSARYAGPGCTPEDNINLLLEELRGIDNRTATFKTIITVIINGERHQFSGEVKGKILKERKGDKGFGYDPIFQPDGFDVSFAEMSIEEKNKISHRAKATSQLVEFLKTIE